MQLAPPPPPPDPAEVHDPAPEPVASSGTGLQVWLVRHGSVEARDVAYGDLDVQLSETGHGETARAAAALAALPPSYVVASPLSRARALGEDVAARARLALALDPRLRELHRGRWQGLALDEYAARWRAEASAYWRDPLGWRGHGGETEAELRARGVAALEEHAARTRAAGGDVLVIAAHRQVLRALVGALLGLPAGASHGLALEPAHAMLVIDEPSGWVLARSNVQRAGAPHVAEPAGQRPGDVF